MKKTLIFALAAVALPSFAASIDWTMSTGGAANYMVGEDGNKLNGTAYLLLTSDVATFDSESAIQDVALGSATITDGINKERQTSTSDLLVAPTEYQFSLIVFDSASSKYFLAADTKTKAAYNLGADMTDYGTAQSISFNAQNLYATAALRGTQTYTSVPEPATAALALLGLGLMIKRRKA